MLNAVYNKVVLRKKSIFYFHPVNLESPINLNIEEITWLINYEMYLKPSWSWQIHISRNYLEPQSQKTILKHWKED